MKCTIPEISWHNRDPVLSVDIQPLTNEGFYRLASGGTDSHVLIWHLKILETGATSIEPVSDLTRHQRAVNVVRWSHSGQYLASGDDDANIIIWHQKPDDLAVMLDGDNDDKEKWNVLKVLRGHKEDVYDICWSPDSSKLISGSVDNTAIIWDLNKGLNDTILTDHKGFVQGVTWDPLGQFVATLSSDRICRIFSETGKHVKARLKKGELPVPKSHVLHGQVVRFYHDDTLKSYFRRLTFSPDGNLIITPAGCVEAGPNNKKIYTSYIFVTSSLNQPVAILPSPGQYTVAARCCPILFHLRSDGPDPVIALPYRIVFAVATRSSVILYDTQQMAPFATISNIHYTRLTDITWSSDGRLLAICSTDGFCSLVTFEPNELGTEYIKETETLEQESCEILNETAEDLDASLNVSIDDKKEKKPSFLQLWTKKEIANNSEKLDISMDNEENSEIKNKNENPKHNIKTNINKELTNTTVEIEDIIILDIEKENKNKENVISQNDKTKNIKTPDSKKKDNVKTPKSASTLTKVQRNSLPAKPIAVRRKPRTETPNVQMNITKFLSPKTTKSTKTTPQNKGVTLLEAFNESEKNSASLKTDDIITINEDSSDDEIPQLIELSEDDSQDIRLVLEETQDLPSQTVDEKMEIDSSKTIETNSSQGKELSTEIETTKMDLDITKVLNVHKKHNEEIQILEVETKKINSENFKEIIDNDINFSDKKQENIQVLENNSVVQNSEEQIKCKDTDCDKQKISNSSDEKSETKETDKLILSNILSQPKNSPVKKRVALITLSSPKHKKKPL